jgi:hypothetical protein
VTAAALPAISSDEYRRAARRLRCRYAGRPDRLQRSLKTLASRTVPAPANRAADRAVVLPPQVRPTTGPAATFAEHLACEIPTNGVLTYSARLALLRDARRLGVGRFEANLLIAAMLERQRRRQPVEPEIDRPVSGTMVLSHVAMFLLVQGAIAFGAWWAVFR